MAYDEMRGRVRKLVRMPEDKRWDFGDRLILPKAGAKSAIDIVADVEYSSCGCEALVDVKTGVGRLEHPCEKHGRFPRNVLRQLV